MRVGASLRPNVGELRVGNVRLIVIIVLRHTLIYPWTGQAANDVLSTSDILFNQICRLRSEVDAFLKHIRAA